MDEHGNSGRLSAEDDTAHTCDQLSGQRLGQSPGQSHARASGDGKGNRAMDVDRTVAAPASQTLLTHRPRGLANLNPLAIAPAAPATSASSIQDLRPFADQLIAIAEQLRTAGPPDAARHHTALHHTGQHHTGQHQSAPPKPVQPGPVLASGNSATDADMPAGTQTGAPSGTSLRDRFAEMARLAYAKRRKRSTIFGDPELFGEPAWDILLDLYIAQAEEKPVSVSSACIGSAAPPTTGLRWLGVLADHGLVEREHDPLDQRRVLVRLTPKALDAMDEYFASSLALHADRRRARG